VKIVLFGRGSEAADAFLAGTVGAPRDRPVAPSEGAGDHAKPAPHDGFRSAS
jgi:hypothetical protein